MFTPPRISFSMFHSEHDPMLQAWGRFRNGIPDAAALPASPVSSALPTAVALPTTVVPLAPRQQPPQAAAPGGVWRLLASNNREVARSAHVYRSFAGAQRHALELKANCDEFELHVVRGPVGGLRGWVFLLGGQPSMTCSRWYSVSSCTESAESALALFQEAVVSDGWRWSSGGPRQFGTTQPADAGRSTNGEVFVATARARVTEASAP